jgi:hypothetical protein
MVSPVQRATAKASMESPTAVRKISSRFIGAHSLKTQKTQIGNLALSE